MLSETKPSWMTKILYWPWGVLLLAITATLATSVAILRPTFSSGPDIGTHIYDTQQFIDLIRAGTWYPRWLGNWYGGYGAPIGVAYPPLTYDLAAIPALLGLPTLTALKIVLWGSFFISGLAMRQLAVEFIHPIGALLAGIVYQVGPYRIFDLYTRGAVPETVAFLWLPIILLLALYCVQRKRLVYCLGLALAIAALLLTHLLIAYIFAFAAWPLGFYLIFRVGANWRDTVARLSLGVGFGLLLSAIYWLPALQESRYMNTAYLDNLMPGVLPAGQEWANYQNNFLFNAQIYIGTSLEGIYRENTEASIGTALLALVGAFALLINLISWEHRATLIREMSLTMAGVLVISVFMSLSISRPLWSVLPRIATMQFPYRWQTVGVLAAAYLAGDLASWIYTRWSVNLPAIALRSLVVPIIFIGLIASVCLYTTWLIRHHSDALSTQVANELTGVLPLSVDNYHWVYDDFYLPPPAVKFDYAAARFDPHLPVVSNTPIEIKIQEWRSQQRIFSVTSPTETVINVRTFWFPGWEARINEQPTPIDVQPGDGTMLLKVPAGVSEITFNFLNTPLRVVGQVVSGTAGLLIIGLAIFGVFLQRTKRTI
jgi:hypothetical protein